MDLRKKLQTLIDREYDALLGYARKLTGSGEGSEDLLQDALLKVLDRADPTLPVRNLNAYLYRTIRNRAVDLFRRKKPEMSLDRTNADDSTTLHDIIKDFRFAAHTGAETDEIRRIVLQAMKQLGEKERALVIATEFEGKTHRELAEQWDVPAGTLMARKKRALEKIRRFLDRHEPELRPE